MKNCVCTWVIDQNEELCLHMKNCPCTWAIDCHKELCLTCLYTKNWVCTWRTVRAHGQLITVKNCACIWRTVPTHEELCLQMKSSACTWVIDCHEELCLHMKNCVSTWRTAPAQQCSIGKKLIKQRLCPGTCWTLTPTSVDPVAWRGRQSLFKFKHHGMPETEDSSRNAQPELKQPSETFRLASKHLED